MGQRKDSHEAVWICFCFCFLPLLESKGILLRFPTAFQESIVGLKPGTLAVSLLEGTKAQGIIRVNSQSDPDPEWIEPLHHPAQLSDGSMLGSGVQQRQDVSASKTIRTWDPTF